MLIYGTTVPTEMKRQRNRGVLGVERKLTINKENHGRVYTKPWFSFVGTLSSMGVTQVYNQVMNNIHNLVFLNRSH